MIQAKTPIVNNQQTIKSVKYYTVANKIIPIRRVSFDMIPRLEEPVSTEIELTKKDIKRVVVEKKRNNPLNKFFKKALRYIDKLEDFIDTLKSLKLKTIVQKKILLETDKSDQKIRQYRAKRIVKETKQAEDQQQQQEVDLKDVGDKLALALGLGALAAGGGGGGNEDEIPTVDYQPVDGQLVPKGTSGVSGYPITSKFGFRWGRTHGGIDVGAPSGTMFAVKAKSQVVFAGWQNPQNHKDGYGLLVDVWVPAIKQMIRFAHLSSVAVKVGQELDAGKVLGKSGSTGYSTGPHFHIEAHDTITPKYGSKDPTPYLGYVILGDTIKSSSTKVGDFDGKVLNNQADGGIDNNKKIMVGEAGTEFVVPLSQMPLFMQSMMEEKIKCLNPFYTPKKVFGDIGIKPSFGKTNKKFAGGAVVVPFNQNHFTAAKKLKILFPQAKDYHIAAAMGNFETESTGMYPNRYQGDYATPPAWTKPGPDPGRGIAQWEINHRGNNNKGRWSQGIKKFGPSLFTDINKQLDFVKWELDSNTQYLPWGNATKREWLQSKDLVSATKNFLEGYEAPSITHMEGRISRAFSFNRNMNKLLGMTTKKDDEPKPKSKPKEKSWWDNFIKAFTTSPDGKSIIKPQKKASLNDIDQSNQMEVAKAYQNQFELNTDNVNQIIPLQIRVHYSETV
jgi:murein DD-endopeptidase MepM/ murein hydrolase activator NlpD